MKQLFLVVALWLVSCCLASAAVIAIPERNFAVDTPAGWMSGNGMPPGAPQYPGVPTSPEPSFTFAVSTDKKALKAVGVIAIALPEDERVAALAKFLNEQRKRCATEGYKISADEDVTINGVQFQSFAVHKAGSESGAFYTGSSGDQSYIIVSYSKATDVSSDPEINGMVSSFRLLSAEGVYGYLDRFKSAVQPYATPQNLGYLAIAVGVYVLWRILVGIFRWLS